MKICTIVTHCKRIILFVQAFLLVFFHNEYSHAQAPATDVNNIDTIIVLKGATYKASLHIFDTNIDWTGQKKNAVFILLKKEKKSWQLLTKDSICSMMPFIHFEDFNGDHVKDVLVFNMTGARSNESYYLYLMQPGYTKPVRVKDFEHIYNPEYDTSEHIITSYTLSGQNYYSFYRIAGNKVVDLGHSFSAELTGDGDSIHYERAIRAIRRKLHAK